MWNCPDDEHDDDDDDDDDDLYSNVLHRWVEQVCNEIDVFCASRLNAAAADTLQNVATEYSNIILLYVILIHIWYLNYDILLYTLIHTSRLNSAADTIHYYTYTFITRLNADTIHY